LKLRILKDFQPEAKN